MLSAKPNDEGEIISTHSKIGASSFAPTAISRNAKGAVGDSISGGVVSLSKLGSRTDTAGWSARRYSISTFNASTSKRGRGIGRGGLNCGGMRARRTRKASASNSSRHR